MSPDRQDPPGTTPLRIAGYLLLAGAAAVVLAKGIGDERSSYEAGELVGVALRDVVIGMIAAVLVSLALRRSRGEKGDWKNPAPEALLLGGAVAMTLALAVGAPKTESEKFAAAADECQAGQASPIEALPASERRELPREQVEAAFAAGGAPQGLADAAAVYIAGEGADTTQITVFAIGDSEQDRADARAGFSDALVAQGLQPQPVTYGGTEATQFSSPATTATALYALEGCYAVAMRAGRPEALQRFAETILGPRSRP